MMTLLRGAARTAPRVKHFGEEPWDFRLVQGEDGGLAIHAVFYDRAGFIKRIDPEPATFEREDANVDRRLELLRELDLAKAAVRDKPIVEQAVVERGGKVR